MRLAVGSRLGVQHDRHAQIARCMRAVIARGELGVRVNLWETYLALAIGSLVGVPVTTRCSSRPVDF